LKFASAILRQQLRCFVAVCFAILEVLLMHVTCVTEMENISTYPAGN
jgi:hypothetical protein